MINNERVITRRVVVRYLLVTNCIQPITGRPTTTACVLNRRQNIPRARAVKDLSGEHVQFSSERAACQCCPPVKTVFFWISPFCLANELSSLLSQNETHNVVYFLTCATDRTFLTTAIQFIFFACIS